MREILFRAKRKDNGEWAEGSYVHAFNENKNCFIAGIMREEHWIAGQNGNMMLIDESTLCQYTGMTDKNGNKIWENDILESHYDDLFPDDVTISKVVWDTNRWAVQNAYSLDIEDLDDFVCGYGEVAGNVFDNPELLKGA